MPTRMVVAPQKIKAEAVEGLESVHIAGGECRTMYLL